MTAFDVSIDLTTDAIPPGLPPLVAVERVREAVKAIAGAGYVDVEWRGGSPPSDAAVRVYQPGQAHPLAGALGERLGRWIRDEVRRALFPSPAAVKR